MKYKLCLVIASLPPGGMERVMSELAGYFCERSELEVHLILYGRIPEVFYNLPENLIVHKPEKAFNDRFRLISTLGRLSFLRGQIRKIKPDSILSFGEFWNSFVLLALLKLPYPIYISDRCSPEKTFSPFHSGLRKWLYPKASGIIAQTETAKQIYANQFLNKNISLIGNPIRQIPKNKKIVKENIVLTVGRLIETKHHDKLIEIFAKINAPDWKLVIVGDDAQKQKNRAKLESLIDNLNMKGKIILAGKQADVDSYYLSSKIFAFTSSSEGFPNVIGEAMSAGIPVISFDCVAGPSDMIIDEENGYLISLFDSESFAKKLKFLMADEKTREKFVLAGTKKINEFSVNEIGEEYLKLLIYSAIK